MKLVVMSDFHAGNLLGLTPKKYSQKGWELSKLMDEYWNWFIKTIPKKIDLLVLNGDLIDGEGKRGSKDHLTTDIDLQVKMAIEIIERINAKKNIFTYGTPYHCGINQDAEKQIAKHFNSNIRTCQKLEVNGVKFNIAHTVNKSGSPNAGDSALKNKILWTTLYSIMDGEDRPDIVIRSHAHEYRLVANTLSKAYICPALQLGNQDYNQYARRLDGWYAVGFLTFDIKRGQDPLSLFAEPHIFKYKVKGGYTKI